MDAAPVTRSRRDLLRVWLPAVCLLTLLIGGMIVLLGRSQAQSRADLVQRNELRAALAGRFVGAYVSDVQKREAAYASAFLSGPTVSAARFRLAASSFGFDAAVLLDARGRALNIVPAQRELIGTRVDASYPHLRAAVGGDSAVSDVTLSESRALPVVAFAVPFETRFGRRVFSGGAQIHLGPLSAFLADALPLSGARAYLIDSKGFVMAAGGSSAAAVEVPPDTDGAHGSVAIAGKDYRFSSAPIAGTRWRVLTLAPSSQLFAPLSGRHHWIPWVVLAAFALASVAALALLSRLVEQKAKLAHLATHDPLTGALNRRTLERVFHRLSAAALRSGTTVGVVAVDLDRFKRVNDTYGHAAGDELLCRIAEVLWLAVRPSDIVARIGGDEFVVLLAEVRADEAQDVAQRIMRTLDEASFTVADGVQIAARCSVGVAIAGQDDVIDTVLARADRALYCSKDARRHIGQVASAG